MLAPPNGLLLYAYGRSLFSRLASLLYAKERFAPTVFPVSGKHGLLRTAKTFSAKARRDTLVSPSQGSSAGRAVLSWIISCIWPRGHSFFFYSCAPHQARPKCVSCRVAFAFSILLRVLVLNLVAKVPVLSASFKVRSCDLPQNLHTFRVVFRVKTLSVAAMPPFGATKLLNNPK